MDLISMLLLSLQMTLVLGKRVAMEGRGKVRLRSRVGVEVRKGRGLLEWAVGRIRSILGIKDRLVI